MSLEAVKVDDVNIASFKPLKTPEEIRKDIPLNSKAINTAFSCRLTIADILNKRDPRKIVILGPCSIHDTKSALEYAAKLKGLAQQVSDRLLLVMRAYFEKPRTVVGWKGFINDPNLDNSFNINKGLYLARQLLLDITTLGVPVATEALEPISPQYISELISWTAIGARTTESQTHRELSSGLSSPVGFKNNTDGNIDVAINAIKSAGNAHHFLGIDRLGRTSIVATKGNPNGHLILRGGKDGPNFDSKSVAQAQKKLHEAGVRDNVVIDCSHDNSSKNYLNQPRVFEDCLKQILSGNEGIIGLMLESHLLSGKQELNKDLVYGVSITDGCIDFDTTAALILDAHKQLKKVR